MGSSDGRSAPPSDDDLAHNARGTLSPAQAAERRRQIRRWRLETLLWFPGGLSLLVVVGCITYAPRWGTPRAVVTALAAIVVLAGPLAALFVRAFRRHFAEVDAGQVEVVRGRIEQIRRSGVGSPIVYLTVAGTRLTASRTQIDPRDPGASGREVTAYYLPRTRAVVALAPPA